MMSWDTYFDRVVAIHLDFAAARKALRAFETTPEAVTAFARAEIDDLAQTISEGSSQTPTIPAERFERLLQDILEEILRTRNIILHENPELDVPEQWLRAFGSMLVAIPWLAVVQGAVLHPNAFQLPELMKRNDAETLVSKNRMKSSSASPDV